jgi:hypothetical protein
MHACRVALRLAAGALTCGVVLAQPSFWLDRSPLEPWNRVGAPIPAAPSASEPRAALTTRCRSIVQTGSPAAADLAQAGWVPFLHVDRRIARDDVEVIGGMVEADAACEPTAFNLFVFVANRYAGALSPVPMRSRADGAVGAVRLTGPDAMTAEFARYTDADAMCCPSSTFRVTYRVNRGTTPPVVEAREVRRIR